MTEHYQHRARKRFGQNFLHDAGVIHREGLIAGRPGLHPEAPFALYRAEQLPSPVQRHRSST